MEILKSSAQIILNFSGTEVITSQYLRDLKFVLSFQKYFHVFIHVKLLLLLFIK